MTERIVTDRNGRKYITHEPLLHQPRRKWYGLTYEDMDNLVAYPWGETKDLVIAIEAKLKEYNT